MSRIILHSDLNNFYASVEALDHPEYRNVPLAVCGDPQARHGIVLAKNNLAKAAGVKTGEAIWQARIKCPELITVPPRMERYLEFSQKSREIYAAYTPQVEAFGLDECWLDISHTPVLRRMTPLQAADEIRQRFREELGLTVSIGIANNKAFAKLGSDMKKPDAVTELMPEHYPSRVFPQPISALLYVGPATTRRLHRLGILTIGDAAKARPETLRRQLGKAGLSLWAFANGLDPSPVALIGQGPPMKSIGNSVTPPRELTTPQDVRSTLFMLADSVASRLRAEGVLAGTVSLWVRDRDLCAYEKQMPLRVPSRITGDLARSALEMFSASYPWHKGIRSLGLRASHLCPADRGIQTCFLQDEIRRQKEYAAECAIDALRSRYGSACVQRAVLLGDRSLGYEGSKKEISSFHPDYLKVEVPFMA